MKIFGIKPLIANAKRCVRGFSICWCIFFFTTCNQTPPLPGTDSPASEPALPSIYTYTIVNTYLHDPNAFTQGLVFEDGFFYEGTGNYGASTIRKVTPATGAVLVQKSIAPNFFGEGVAIFGDRLYQLTWKSGICFVYDKSTFELQVQFTYSTEGWGLTHDGEKLIMSDGTNIIYFRDPNTFREIGRIEVNDSTGPVHYLNELEYIKGQIFANVWQTDRIARIDPKSGKITGWINLTGILSQTDRLHHRVGVLNGIAYDAVTDRIFVTGKWWPKLFEIKLIQ